MADKSYNNRIIVNDAFAAKAYVLTPNVTHTADPYDGNGGLAEVLQGGNLSGTDVVFTGSSVTGNGGVICSNGTSVELDHAKVSGNTAGESGGAIYNNNGTVTLTDLTFKDNVAVSGGAIYNKKSLILDNVTFSGNTATDANGGGAIWNSGTIDLCGDVYLSSESDTIYMDTGATMNWTIDGNDNGYLSDYSYITGSVGAETFTIDAENAQWGHCYILAGDAADSDGKTFTITVTGADGAEMHTMTVNGDALYVEGVRYLLGVNGDNQLTLSTNEHTDVEDCTWLINSVQNYSWGGMGTYDGNGSMFAIKSNGNMTNVFNDGESNFSYAASFMDGSAGQDEQGNGGNGGILYNEGCVTLDNAHFENNTAEGNGGAICSTNQVYVTNSEFGYNWAENGGAVYIAGGSANALSGIFAGNYVTGKGGAIYVASGAALTWAMRSSPITMPMKAARSTTRGTFCSRANWSCPLPWIVSSTTAR